LFTYLEAKRIYQIRLFIDLLNKFINIPSRCNSIKDKNVAFNFAHF